MFATFAPMILWFAHTIAAFAPMIAAFALGIFSKTHQSSLSINGGIFSKITPSLFTIKEGSTAFPKPLSPQGDRGCANRPTRCSNRFAIRLADHQRSRQQQSCILRYATAWTRIA